MSTAQTCHPFVNELKDLGITIPKDTVNIEILCKAGDPVVKVKFEVADFGNDLGMLYGTVFKTETFTFSNGENISAKDFYRMIKKDAQLPDETTSFKIKANIGEIVSIEINAALPENSLEGLKHKDKYLLTKEDCQ